MERLCERMYSRCGGRAFEIADAIWEQRNDIGLRSDVLDALSESRGYADDDPLYDAKSGGREDWDERGCGGNRVCHALWVFG